MMMDHVVLFFELRWKTMKCLVQQQKALHSTK